MPLPRDGTLEGPLCLALFQIKASFAPYNSQLTLPTKVTLSILELGHIELFYAHHFNPM
jgi:hypothetical protein